MSRVTMTFALLEVLAILAAVPALTANAEAQPASSQGTRIASSAATAMPCAEGKTNTAKPRKGKKAKGKRVLKF